MTFQGRGILYGGSLDGISIGRLTHEHYDCLRMSRRRAAILTSERNAFADAMRLFPANEAVREYNKLVLESSDYPVAKILAEHNNNVAKKGSDEQGRTSGHTSFDNWLPSDAEKKSLN